jgi:hypothetical protein
MMVFICLYWLCHRYLAVISLEPFLCEGRSVCVMVLIPNAVLPISGILCLFVCRNIFFCVRVLILINLRKWWFSYGNAISFLPDPACSYLKNNFWHWKCIAWKGTHDGIIEEHCCWKDTEPRQFYIFILNSTFFFFIFTHLHYVKLLLELGGLFVCLELQKPGNWRK